MVTSPRCSTSIPILARGMVGPLPHRDRLPGRAGWRSDATLWRHHHRIRERTGGRARVAGRLPSHRAGAGMWVAVRQESLPEKAQLRTQQVLCDRIRGHRPGPVSLRPTLFPAIPGRRPGWATTVARGSAPCPIMRSARGLGCLGARPGARKRLPLQPRDQRHRIRHPTGQTVHFPVQQNLHRDGIPAVTQVPATRVPADSATGCRRGHAGRRVDGLRRRAVCVESLRHRRRSAGGQRDGSATPQLGPLHDRRLRCEPARTVQVRNPDRFVLDRASGRTPPR